MGHVALSAAYYLMSKLGMYGLAELRLDELFDVDHVSVNQGLIAMGRRARNRFFAWTDPEKKRVIIVFMGEAQPPLGRYAFCQKLIEFAQALGVQRVVTFAAMATQMHPEHKFVRVFCAANRRGEPSGIETPGSGGSGGRANLRSERVASRRRGGKRLRGVSARRAAAHGIFSQVPFPKASLAVLEIFTKLSGIEIDFSGLAEQSRLMEKKMGQILAHGRAILGEGPAEEPEIRCGGAPGPVEEPRLRRKTNA